MDSARSRHARALFAGIAPQYERMGRLLSLGQEAVWRRYLVSTVNVAWGSLVLDVASGTGLVARELAVRRDLRVVQLDLSEPMLRAGLEATRSDRLNERVLPVLGRAERLPFEDEAFDAVAFTYLLRYVDDPSSTLRELVRVVRPRGVVSCLEFHVPERPVAKAGWRLYTRALMPVLGALTSPAWTRTARFLGPSIEDFYRRYPLPEQVRWWQDAGLDHVRSRTFLLGSAIVIRGVKRGS
jgi:demethylmenaquinone methyltransferase / 2-methoxy-6-polyprenyl-1,4-benzoquinol methylase